MFFIDTLEEDEIYNTKNLRLRGKDRHLWKKAFSIFAHSKLSAKSSDNEPQWLCCGSQFADPRHLHQHIASAHSENVHTIFAKISPENPEESSIGDAPEEDNRLPIKFDDCDEFPWLPLKERCLESCDDERERQGRILLFYKYRQINEVHHVYSWQKTLCERLGLTGKIRVAKEGLNGTVGGSHAATQLYIDSVIRHPLFCDMTYKDFKTSPGCAADFPGGLKVGIFAEVCPMGVPPAECLSSEGGEHLSVEEFHDAVDKYLRYEDERDKAVFIDCRNFYESRIGKFEGALIPDIRKFSYWPEYVDKNLDLFKDKSVYMYCTGGIRCERGSAYLKSKTQCSSVYQLEGGVHKYIERYPEGHFRGKLFVFDDRYYIQANNDIIAKCSYCGQSWDQYTPCTTEHCHQLVISCTKCCEQGLTACCRTCQDHQESGTRKEECECTRNRPRIPTEKL